MKTQILQSNHGAYVDRPDVAKNVKPSLTMKEVNDCIIKFLMLSDLPFSGKQSLPLTTEFTYRKGTKFSEVMQLQQNYYTVTCKLDKIKVDKKPIYLVVIPETLSELNNRQRNKLITLTKQYKVVILDNRDWKGAGLDISDKKWLKPLNRRALKSLARKIFSKIASLGEVQSDITLNDVFESIDNNTNTKSLEQENFALKAEVRKLYIKENFEFFKEHDKILDKLTNVTTSSLQFIEKLCTFSIKDCLGSLDLKKSTHKQVFRLKNGKVKILNKEALASYVFDNMTSKKGSNLDVTNLGHGVLQIKNKKTFQVVNLAFTCSNSSNSRPVSIPSNVYPNLQHSLLFNIHVVAPYSGTKLESVQGYVILTNNYNVKYNYTNRYKMQVYSSERRRGGLEEYTLWSFINDGF